MGSLFDGIGGFILAGNYSKIDTLWSSEIDPCCEAVTKEHFPYVEQLGDITKINGATVDPVDIICGGSPCQDLSIAGKRAGMTMECKTCGYKINADLITSVCPMCGGELDTTRSGLYMQQIRIIREMRAATNNQYPRYMVWENVPGALSSNKGEDFNAVIEEAAKCAEVGISIPQPKKWNNSGCIVGNGWSIAWRILDAQYWGVPQRRRRIFLVADFGGERAGEILFKSEGLRGYFEEGREARERTAKDAERSVDGSVFNESGQGYWMPEFGCLRAEGENRPSRPGHVVCQSQIYAAAFMGGQGAKARTIAYNENVSPSIKSVPSGSNTVPDIVYALQGNGIDRNDNTGCAGKGVNENISYTLNTIDKHAICFPIDQHQQDTRFKLCEDGIIPTMSAKMGTGGNNTPMVLEKIENTTSNDFSQHLASGHNATGTLMACHATKQWLGNQEAFGGNYHIIACGSQRKYIIRRLTPMECERLQGYPDGWTDIAYKGKPMSDSARYRMLGNSVAIPCVVRVLSGISDIS